MNESDLERASELALQEVAYGIKRAAMFKGLTPKGVCYNCHEPLEKFSGACFCEGGECRDDFEYREMRRKA